MLGNLNLQLQFASLCFLVMICVSYQKYKRLPMLSTRMFSCMLFLSIVNVFLDMAVIYTVSVKNYLLLCILSRLYLVSLLGIVVAIFVYVMMLARQNRKMSALRRGVYFVPYSLLLISLCLCSGPLNTDGSSQIWISIIRYFAYGALWFYAVHILLATYLYKSSFSREIRYVIRVVIYMWVIVFFLHIKYPAFPLVSLTSSLTVFVLYLSCANPLDYLEKETGLFSRHAYQQIIVEKMKRKPDIHIICILLEDMMIINSKFGYKMGNLLLSQIGEFIENMCGEYVYHPWGMVLSIIVPAKRDRDYCIVENIAQRFLQSWDIEGQLLRLSPRIGVLECPECVKTADDVQDIVGYFKESASTDGTFAHFGILGKEYLSGKARSLKIESLIVDAIRNDGIEVFYQPIYSCKKNKFVSAEALVRLKDVTTIGYVSPEEFIPIAEKKGLISELGAMVFRKVCSFISTHNLRDLGIEYIEINLSGVQCMNSCLPEELDSIMKEYNVEPGFLNLEITETAAIGGNNSIQDNISALRTLGFSFSMDDFGTGFSNLSQIVNLTYDLIKIDKSLIWPYFEKDNTKAQVLLDNIVNMIQQLKINIVAEGIETEEQRRVLDKMGIDYLQGFYFSKPIAEKSFLDFMMDAGYSRSSQHEQYWDRFSHHESTVRHGQK